MSYANLTSNSTLLSAFRTNIIARISANAVIDPSFVKILSLIAGSVVTQVQVTSPADPAGFGGSDSAALARIDATLASIVSAPNSTFDVTFQLRFAVSSVDAVLGGTGGTTSSKLPTKTLIGIVAGAGVGGGLVVGLIVFVTVALVMRRRRTRVEAMPVRYFMKM
ncbi:MAG: hypothetical protein WDW38_003836 [Sanguina aurantia]